MPARLTGVTEIAAGYGYGVGRAGVHLGGPCHHSAMSAASLQVEWVARDRRLTVGDPHRDLREQWLSGGAL